MKKAVVIFLAVMMFGSVLSGCTEKKTFDTGSKPADTAQSATSDPAEQDDGKTAEHQEEAAAEASVQEQTKTDENVFEWLSYRLVQEELRDVTDSDTFVQDKPPAGSRYVVVKFVSADEEMKHEELTKENLARIILMDTSDNEYNYKTLSVWNVRFDPKSGFSMNEMQEGFQLVFVVPESVELQDLQVFVKEEGVSGDGEAIKETLYEGSTAVDGTIESISVSFFLSEDKSTIRDVVISMAGLQALVNDGNLKMQLDIPQNKQTHPDEIAVDYEGKNENIPVDVSTIESLVFHEDGSAELVLNYRCQVGTYDVPVPGIHITLAPQE